MMAIYKIKTDSTTSDLRGCIEEANANMLYTPANELLKKDRLALFDEMTDLYDKMKINPGEVSDGYHTFNELYHHRAILFATICNTYPTKAWKSLQHDDPNFPMYKGMFIVGIETPDGQATYHYDIDPYWNIFNVKELERAPKYDGHTPDEAIRRIGLMGGFDLSK